MSIRLRFALYYGGLTGLGVVLVCIIVYVVHTRAHYDDIDLMLIGSAEHVAGRTAENSPKQQLAEQLSVPVSQHVAVKAYGPEGRLVAESPNASLAPKADPRAVLANPSGPPFDPIAGLGPQFISVDASRGDFGLARDSDGNRWRVYVVPTEGPARYLVASASLDEIDVSVQRFRRLLVLLAVVSIAVALISSALLAGHSLRPVKTLTKTAGAIGRSRNFRERVSIGKRQDELGELSSTFNEMLDSLDQAYQTEQRFVADASHELRAPLTAIQGNLDLLLRHPEKPPEEQREALEEADRESRRLARLVSNLLELARADAGMSLRHQRVELDRVLLDAFADAKHLARGQRVEVDALEPALVEGDADRLKELLLILLDNALKYTPPEGEVTLGLRRKDEAAEITVEDTGVGIPPGDLPLVFDRFYRADPARARDPGGTGLGLSIARWIADQHGGEVKLDSEAGSGTTVTVRLPIETGSH